MDAHLIPINQLNPNIGQVKGLPKNPRFIRDAKYKKLLQSIKDDPEMLELRELIVYDANNADLGFIVIGGNMRFRAMKELGYKDAPCKVLHTGFPIEKMRRIILKDNSSFGDTDFNTLIAEWSIDEIETAAIDVPNIEATIKQTQEPIQAPTPVEQAQQPTAQEEYRQSIQRTESIGEIDVTKFETKQTLSLSFTPEEYMFVLERLREYSDNFSQALLLMLDYQSYEQ